VRCGFAGHDESSASLDLGSPGRSNGSRVLVGGSFEADQEFGGEIGSFAVGQREGLSS
jgi:hypothetical protein